MLGNENDSKSAFFFNLREAAGFSVITLRFSENSLAAVRAIPSSSCTVSTSLFQVPAQFYHVKKRWVFTSFNLTGERRSVHGKDQQKTAYTSFDLSVFDLLLMGGNPGVNAKTLAAIFKPTISHPRGLSPNHGSGGKNCSSFALFGSYASIFWCNERECTVYATAEAGSPGAKTRF